MTEKKQDIKQIYNSITLEIRKEMETIYFTADLHAYHNKIIAACNRPVTPETHEQWLLDNINNTVSKNHRLYILGDVSMANKKLTELFLDKIKCKSKFLILGNHDRNIEHSTRFESISQMKDFTFEQFGMNIHIVLCHYAMMSWNRSIHGSCQLFGHSHGRIKTNLLSFDVGVDADPTHPYPYSLYEVIEILANKEIVIND